MSAPPVSFGADGAPADCGRAIPAAAARAFDARGRPPPEPRAAVAGSSLPEATRAGAP